VVTLGAALQASKLKVEGIVVGTYPIDGSVALLYWRLCVDECSDSHMCVAVCVALCVAVCVAVCVAA